MVHAPTFRKKIDSKRLWPRRKSDKGWEEYLDALVDPRMTNLNFHAHIRFTTRRVDGKKCEFLGKTRELDDKKAGSECILKIRAEWEKRTNAALARVGCDARIDLRSYADMAKAGDAPAGLESQKHMGPKQTARTRRAKNKTRETIPRAAIKREDVRDRNEERWMCWQEIRRLEREKLRLQDAARIADERERARRQRVLNDKRQISEAKTAGEQRAAIEAATSIDTIDSGNGSLAAALAWARSREEAPGPPLEADDTTKKPGEQAQRNGNHCSEDFNVEIDLETFISPDLGKTPNRPFRVKRKAQRRHGQRVRG